MTVTPFSTRTMNLAHFVEQQARRLANEPALVWGDKVWSWSAFQRRACAMSAVFASKGVEKGDCVLVQSRNCNQLFESLFACLRLGAIWVPANFRGMPDDLAWMQQLSGAKLLLCDAAFPDHVSIAGLDTILSIGDSDFGDDIDRLMDNACDTPSTHSVDRDDPAWLFFTSGTSGRPKASMLTHGQLGFVVNNHLCDLVPGITHKDASLVVAPLSHGAGVHQLLMVARGAPTILTTSPRFDTDEIGELIARWRITNVFTVPTILNMIVASPEFAKHDHSSLRYVIYAGAPMYRRDQIRAIESLGDVLVQYFGLGEVTGAITVLPSREHSTTDNARTGTCGYPRTGMQVEIQTEDGTVCAAGETGEICVTGPAVFAGYWRNPEANAASFRNGMFRTGDIGHMDDEGYVYITGRASDMYISGGSNIYPRELEEKLLQHPDVAEVAIFGMPDDKWGEIGVAVVSPEHNASPTVDELDAFLRERVASYKMPHRFYLWDTIPKSGYGKLAKRLIRDELERRQREGEL